jgi:hypothetical protein
MSEFLTNGGMENDDPNAERGAAACHIKLTEGVITVRHTDHDGPVLLRVPAHEGDWQKLWDCLEGLGDTSRAIRAA